LKERREGKRGNCESREGPGSGPSVWRSDFSDKNAKVRKEKRTKINLSCKGKEGESLKRRNKLRV